MTSLACVGGRRVERKRRVNAIPVLVGMFVYREVTSAVSSVQLGSVM